MSAYVKFVLLFAGSISALPAKGRHTKDYVLPLFQEQDASATKDSQEGTLFSPDTLKILAEKIMEMISKGDDISQDDLPEDLRKLVSNIENVCRDDNEVKSSSTPKKSHRQGRKILDKLTFASINRDQRGRALSDNGGAVESIISGKDLPLELLPEKLGELITDVELLCDLDKHSNTTREGRGLLSRLSFLTGLHFGSIFSGTGTIAASQSLNFLGRIVNSVLSVSYGPAGGIGGINGGGIGGGGFGGVGGLGGFGNGINGNRLPTVPVGDDPTPIHDEIEEDQNRVKIKHPHHFLWDHNKRVENFNSAVNSSAGYRQGRID